MRVLSIGVLLLLGCAAPAGATDVTFSGTLVGVCTLALATPGLLGLSTDGEVLGSEELGGLSATITILSIGSNTVTVGAPTRTAAPGGYNASGEVIEVSYAGLGGLSLINEAYRTTSSNFAVSTLPLTALVINTRITNPNGFDAGSYGTKTVVTCS